MNSSKQDHRHHGGRRSLPGNRCPSCGFPVPADAQWCGACSFTGSDSMAQFEGPPPPLLPILDAVGLWDEVDVNRIGAACEKMRYRFPQFRFHICTVMLPAETSLPLFGFWLLNACPLDGDETNEDRSWTVLLLLNAKTGQAAVVPAYAAEHWVTDEDWSKILDSMVKPWKSGKTANAVIEFLKSTGAFLDQTWKGRGLRRSTRSRS